MAKIKLSLRDLDIIAEIIQPGLTAKDLKTLHLEFEKSYVEVLEREDGRPKQISTTPIFIERVTS